MVLNVLMMLCKIEKRTLVNLSTPKKKMTLTQMEVVINSITNNKDTEDEVKQRSDRGIFTVNVSSLVTAPRTRRLGSFNSTLG